MFELGDKVKVNDKGMSSVKQTLDRGESQGPIPETLVGEVVQLDIYIVVNLPVFRTNGFAFKTKLWNFTPDELTK